MTSNEFLTMMGMYVLGVGLGLAAFILIGCLLWELP